MANFKSFWQTNRWGKNSMPQFIDEGPGYTKIIKYFTIDEQEGQDGPGVAHLSLLDCDSKI